MAEDILHDHFNALSGVTLVPSGGGVFEVTLGDRLIYSKKQTGEFPEPADILNAVGGNGS